MGNCKRAAASFLGLNITHSCPAEADVGCPGPVALIIIMVFVQKERGKGRRRAAASGLLVLWPGREADAICCGV
jgi:hypothetical protein